MKKSAPFMGLAITALTAGCMVSAPAEGTAEPVSLAGESERGAIRHDPGTPQVSRVTVSCNGGIVEGDTLVGVTLLITGARGSTKTVASALVNALLTSPDLYLDVQLADGRDISGVAVQLPRPRPVIVSGPTLGGETMVSTGPAIEICYAFATIGEIRRDKMRYALITLSDSVAPAVERALDRTGNAPQGWVRILDQPALVDFERPSNR